MATLITKLAVWCNGALTLRAYHFQFISALFAELGLFSILKLALWTFHLLRFFSMANLPEVRSGGYKDGVNPVFFLNKDSIL
jgi:hypothetical protein